MKKLLARLKATHAAYVDIRERVEIEHPFLSVEQKQREYTRRCKEWDRTSGVW